jgi:hypothetical protein
LHGFFHFISSEFQTAKYCHEQPEEGENCMELNQDGIMDDRGLKKFIPPIVPKVQASV